MQINVSYQTDILYKQICKKTKHQTGWHVNFFQHHQILSAQNIHAVVPIKCFWIPAKYYYPELDSVLSNNQYCIFASRVPKKKTSNFIKNISGTLSPDFTFKETFLHEFLDCNSISVMIHRMWYENSATSDFYMKILW